MIGHSIVQSIRQAVRVLHEGGLVLFPTETVYGLGANATNAQACRYIYQLKQRPIDNPLIVHFYSLKMIKSLLPISPVAEILLRAFSPGPLTVVLSCQGDIFSEARAGSPTVAVRIPHHPTARALLKNSRIPIAAPSANVSGMLSPTRYDMLQEILQAYRKLDMAVKLFALKGTKIHHGLESTIVDSTVYPIRILRPGVITRDDIEKKTRLEIAEGPSLKNQKETMPGDSRYRHYSPCIPLYLFYNSDDIYNFDLSSTLVLGLEGKLSVMLRQKITGKVTLFKTIKEYEQTLYAALYATDICVRIFAELPQSCSDALQDRLQRAATGYCIDLSMNK